MPKMSNFQGYYRFLVPLALMGLVIIGAGGYRAKTTPLVSVVMPTYNRAHTLPAAIDSILNQSFSDFEFIIVDDGSTDESAALLKQYAAQDKRIRLFKNPQNKGVAFSRQQGLDAARGLYVAMMDSDDISYPDRLKRAVLFMTDHPEITALSAVLSYEGQPAPYTDVADYRVKLSSDEVLLTLLFFNNFPNGSSFMRRDFIRQHHLRYQEVYQVGEDYDFWRQMLLSGGHLVLLAEPMVRVHRHTSNAMGYYNNMYQNALRVKKNLWQTFAPAHMPPIQYDYTLPEKCRILVDLKKEKPETLPVSKAGLNRFYHALCPENLETAYYLIHPYWCSYFAPTKEGLWRLASSGDLAKLEVLSPTHIRLLWQSYAPEDFVKTPEGNWLYSDPKQERIYLKHPYWEEFVRVKDGRLCRSKISECATVRFSRKGKRLSLKWENPDYAPEDFYYQDGRYLLEEK